jgi:hypothetical protein
MKITCKRLHLYQSFSFSVLGVTTFPYLSRYREPDVSELERNRLNQYNQVDTKPPQQQVPAISDQQQTQFAHEHFMQQQQHQQQNQSYSDQQYNHQQQLFNQQYQQYQQQQSKEFRQMSDFPMCAPPYTGHPDAFYQQWPLPVRFQSSPMPLSAFFHTTQPPPYMSYPPSPMHALSPPPHQSFNPILNPPSPCSMLPPPSNFLGGTEVEKNHYVHKEDSSVAMIGLDNKEKEKKVGFELPSN